MFLKVGWTNGQLGWKSIFHRREGGNYWHIFKIIAKCIRLRISFSSSMVEADSIVIFSRSLNVYIFLMKELPQGCKKKSGVTSFKGNSTDLMG